MIQYVTGKTQGSKLISRGYPDEEHGEWPSCSPDLTVCDFWLWTAVKRLVWPSSMHQSERPKIMPDLKRAILATIDTLNEDQNQINRACLHARVRAQLCLDADRKHF